MERSLLGYSGESDVTDDIPSPQSSASLDEYFIFMGDDEPSRSSKNVPRLGMWHDAFSSPY